MTFSTLFSHINAIQLHQCYSATLMLFSPINAIQLHQCYKFIFLSWSVSIIVMPLKKRYMKSSQTTVNDLIVSTVIRLKVHTYKQVSVVRMTLSVSVTKRDTISFRLWRWGYNCTQSILMVLLLINISIHLFQFLFDASHLSVVYVQSCLYIAWLGQTLAEEVW